MFLRCLFPDQNLDRLLRLEERLQRKLKQAAAAVGIGHVLPGVDPVERVIAETRERIEQIRREDAALFDDDTNAAVSGEEYRRRLANAFAGVSQRVDHEADVVGPRQVVGNGVANEALVPAGPLLE